VVKKKEATDIGTMAGMPDEGFVSTGIDEVDDLLGGGFPTHRITQVYGAPGVGKGYLMTMAMINPKIKVLYVDAEFAMNKTRAESAGVILKDIDFLASSQLEEVAEYILNNLSKYDLVIIDSLAALTPMTIAQNEVGTSTIGLVARQIGHFIAKLRPLLYTTKTAVVGINQIRANMGYGAAESKPFGGFSWAHAIDLSLKLTKGANNAVQKQTAGIKHHTGHYCTVKIDKSRIGDFGGETRFLVDYTVGTAPPKKIDI
jgi:recombination protein RecA